MSLGLRPGHNGVPSLPQPPLRMRGELLNRFKVAIVAGDLDAFDAYLSIFGPDKEVNIHDLYPVAFEAIRQDSATAIERSLCHGVTMGHNFVLAAIRVKAKRSLDVMVERWDIDTPISHAEPTVLAYACCNFPPLI
ncbi:hypothetical protein F5883DRAFT_697512 [Diaporthe sp. PMI_573]|nr:hypothetical protein F5883DRAFT_697512 [Diaporthaceae sp. PMI_573]